LTSHENFKKKHDLPFDLIADENASLCQLFDTLKMKNMYGKQVQGIERSTFLIDEDSILRFEWRKVKVKGHCQAILDKIASL
jgi:peroxiredoxin Q/BCP